MVFYKLSKKGEEKENRIYLIGVIFNLRSSLLLSVFFLSLVCEVPVNLFVFYTHTHTCVGISTIPFSVLSHTHTCTCSAFSLFPLCDTHTHLHVTRDSCYQQLTHTHGHGSHTQLHTCTHAW